LSGFPWARTDPEVLPALKHVLIAGVAAYALPVVGGLVIALSMAEAELGSRFPTLYVISAFAAYSGLFSWLGVIPGALTNLLLDGTINAVVTLRVGHLAKARCRAFTAWTETERRRILTEVRDATASAAKGVFTEIAKAVGKGAAGLPGKVAGKVKDGIANVLKSFRGGEGEAEPSEA